MGRSRSSLAEHPVAIVGVCNTRQARTLPGETTRSVITRAILGAIEDCQEGLVLVSPDSVNSWWVAFEIGALSGQRKTVTPILNGVDPKSMASMGDVHAIDLNEFDKFLIQLKSRM